MHCYKHWYAYIILVWCLKALWGRHKALGSLCNMEYINSSWERSTLISIAVVLIYFPTNKEGEFIVHHRLASIYIVWFINGCHIYGVTWNVIITFIGISLMGRDIEHFLTHIMTRFLILGGSIFLILCTLFILVLCLMTQEC